MKFTALTEDQEKLLSKLAKIRRRSRALALNGLLAKARLVVVNALLAAAEREKADKSAAADKKIRFTPQRIRKLTRRKEAARRRVQHCAVVQRRVSLQLGIDRARLAQMIGE